MWGDGGPWFWGVVMMVIFLGAIVALIITFARYDRHDVPTKSAREVLDERFARGELGEAEYEHQRDVLSRRTHAPQG